LFVAYVINPVFAASFMKRKKEGEGVNHKETWAYAGGAIVIGLLFHLGGSHSFANFMIFMGLFVAFYNYILRLAVEWFQNSALPAVKNFYKATLRWSLDHPWTVISASVGFIILTMAFVQASNLKFIQFPKTEPNFVYVFNELPNGTNIEETDSVTRILEEKVFEVIGKDNPLVKSIITNVAIGAGDPQSFDQSTSKPHKSKISIEFVGVKERNGASTTEILEKVRENVKGIAGTKISVAQDDNGPPGSAPIEIMVSSEEFGRMMDVSEDLFAYLDSISSRGQLQGFEEMKWDVDEKRPEVMVVLNREKASEIGLSSGQIGMELRTALFGKEVSKFRTNEDEYNIILKLDEKYRKEISSLLNMRVTFMDMATGRFKSVPISAVADIEYSASYGGINRSDLEKAVTITANVPTEYNVNDVFNEVDYWVSEYIDKGRNGSDVNITLGGQTQDMAEEGAFLGGAFAAAIILIFMILVTQFNSFSNVLIILSQVLLSIVGVFLAHAILNMEFSVVLSGVGIVTLAGIVVNNGIILLDFFQILQKRGYSLKDSIIEGGAIRFNPVILTASSTILGLVPLALSLNINFATLLSSLDPQIFFGGDSAAFWEPFAWSIVFGLGFATVITLVIVPVIYYQVKRFEQWFWEKVGSKEEQINDEEENDYSEKVSENGYHNGANGSNNGKGKTKESEDHSEIEI
ncbi:MAG: efflux RND transporter permease subunit, partial [Bacteroidetes bacterium]|nr:efflux RND transporter permease subunit [Bacteroidota bacterium]